MPRSYVTWLCDACSAEHSSEAEAVRCAETDNKNSPFVAGTFDLKPGWSAYQCDPCANQFYSRDLDDPRCGMCGGPPTIEDDGGPA